jgi:hypothetical protein
MSYYTHHRHTDVQYVHLDVPLCHPVDVHSEESVSGKNTIKNLLLKITNIKVNKIWSDKNLATPWKEK